MLFYLIYGCLAHISLSFPPSRRNQLSKYYSDWGLVNYNLRSPLTVPPDYFSFPCKGFPKGPSVATFDSNTISITLEGTATHGGGHCQIGVSYDDTTFVVLKTVLNNCLLDSMTYSFDLPENVSSGNLTVFWTWINRIGNREYYMECSDVTINNSKHDTNTNIQGKELLVVNIGNNPKVPEWEIGALSSIDGRDLLEQRKDVIITNYNSNKPKKSKKRKFKNKYIPNQKKQKTKNKEKSTHQDCILGEMRCNDSGFDTCVYNNWIYRNCAPGTSCKQNGNNIFCV